MPELETAIDSELKLKADTIKKPQETVHACGFFVSGDDLRFRPMTTADMDEIMVIERTSYRVPVEHGIFSPRAASRVRPLYSCRIRRQDHRLLLYIGSFRGLSIFTTLRFTSIFAAVVSVALFGQGHS